VHNFQYKGAFTPPGDFEAYVMAIGTINHVKQVLWTFYAEGYTVERRQYVMGPRDTASVWMINGLLAIPALLLVVHRQQQSLKEAKEL